MEEKDLRNIISENIKDTFVEEQINKIAEIIYSTYEKGVYNGVRLIFKLLADRNSATKQETMNYEKD